MKTRFLIPLACALVAVPAAAQNVYNATRAQSQPLVERNENGFSRCGIRVMVQDEHNKGFDIHDMNVNVFPSHHEGMIEATRLRSTEAELLKKARPGPQGAAATTFWMAASTDAKAVKPIDYLASKTPGKMIAMTPLAGTHQLIADIASGKRMQFSARYPGQTGGERIVSFAAGLSAQDAETLDACLESMPQ